ncbi:plasmid recombination enzyme [Primorskyibacter sedentarius]|uniref:Plasmid recombination enzyme n=1 Tax=Primorskyibacter sedentarius TaxID=745311 RepID=A0A4V2UNS5_9RHOB|nr:plasmid recombination protein [Primorskyibacter sedentarius]TCS63171.1 plasmid recombination enzyme [Primorskyibacter sedentarius]
MTSKKHPIVLRFAGMDPTDIGGYEAHRYRKYGDLGHIDRNKPEPRRLLGTRTWAQEALAEINLIKMETFAAELAELDRRNRRKDLKKRRIEGPRNPWRASRHGPLREVILTANKDWFEETESSDELFNTARERQFEERAIAWLKENFGDDVIHARADTDEQAYHIHAVIMPRATVHKYGVECQVLQPSVHPLIKNYEAAQDSVGEWFSDIGLVRGEARKQAIRDALHSGKAPPKKRRHVRPAEWRAQEEVRLAQKAARLETRRRDLTEREENADVVIAYAEAVASGDIDEDGKPREAMPATNAPIPPARRSGIGFATARKAFRTAAQRLAKRAEAKAKQAAERRIAAEVSEIKKADDVILQIAQHLPKDLRARIAQIRRQLTASIMVLDPELRAKSSSRRAANKGKDQP